ncbi:MAG: short-chain dehydrogenase/reductase [Pseudonocardiales bacterium]|nr:short-chain dehydrogenase/reductase [Pseudonocardiales bacterium]
MPSVLITGASKGIGRATAAEFSRRGYRVIATARDLRALADLDVDQRLRLDVTDQATVDEAVGLAGDVDILVSNAGVIFHGAVEASPPAEIERLFAQNTSGSIRVAQALLPQMRRRGSGRLLFMSSVVGRIVLPGNAAYAASKWAMEALVEALATEVRHFGINTTLLQPGPVASGALDDMLSYTLRDDPYAGLMAQRGDLSSPMISPEAVASAVADVAELETAPLRVPIGKWARDVLAARRAASDDVAFVPMTLDW